MPRTRNKTMITAVEILTWRPMTCGWSMLPTIWFRAKKRTATSRALRGEMVNAMSVASAPPRIDPANGSTFKRPARRPRVRGKGTPRAQTGNGTLARRALLVSLGGAKVSPALLIMDLGRPERFYNMLRVVKPMSPMSLGTWVLSAFGISTGAAVAGDVLGILPRVGRALEVASALFAPALSTYTAVLVADTSVPVWHEARRELPLVFAASAGAAAMLTPAGDAARPGDSQWAGLWRGSDRWS